MYRGKREKKKALAGGGVLGGSLLATRQGLAGRAVGQDVRSAESRHIPEVLAAEGVESRGEQWASMPAMPPALPCWSRELEPRVTFNQ